MSDLSKYLPKIAELVAVLEDLAERRTLSDHCGELDYLIEDAREALGRDPGTNTPKEK